MKFRTRMGQIMRAFSVAQAASVEIQHANGDPERQRRAAERFLAQIS